MIPERTPGLLVLIAALLAVLAGSWLAIMALVDLPDTARAGRTTISLRTLEVAPGDPLRVRVVVRGGKRTAIEEIKVRGGERELRIAGPGATWGSSFRAGSRDQGMADRDLRVEVPADAPPGTSLRLRFEVRSVTAEETAYQRFENVATTDVVTLDVPILSAGARTRGRGIGAAQVLLLLAAAAAAVWLATPPVARQLRRRPRSALGAPAMLLVIAAVLLTLTILTVAAVYGLAGWFHAARRLTASTEIFDDWFAWLCVGGWIAIPALAGYAAARRVAGEISVTFAPAPLASEVPFRGAAGLADAEPPPAVTLGALASALTAAQLPARRRGRHLTVRERHARLLLTVRAADSVRAADISGWTRSPALAAHAALALVPVLGPLALHLGDLGTLTVDGTEDRAALGRRLAELTRRQLADLLARVSAIPKLPT